MLNLYSPSGVRNYLLLSTDTLPTIGVEDGSTAYMDDTKTGWIYDSKNINSVTTTGWWGL